MRSRWDAWSTSAHRAPCPSSSKHHQRGSQLYGGFSRRYLCPGRLHRPQDRTPAPRQWISVDILGNYPIRLYMPQGRRVSRRFELTRQGTGSRTLPGGMLLDQNALLLFQNRRASGHIQHLPSTTGVNPLDFLTVLNRGYQGHYTTNRRLGPKPSSHLSVTCVTFGTMFVGRRAVCGPLRGVDAVNSVGSAPEEGRPSVPLRHLVGSVAVWHWRRPWAELKRTFHCWCERRRRSLHAPVR